MMKLCVSIAIVALLVVQATAERPSFIGCVDSKECNADSCCVIGQNRYSIPACQALRKQGDSCRGTYHKALNTTVQYPNGYSVDLVNVYMDFCKCAPGLTCSMKTFTCEVE